ncbi:hypothetical protein ABZ678_39315 [Streptomyces hirsutus]|uniref:hypothetical protein n=1 Tax=Streptomyces hirsutus TaxID=35620 RepID=UPI0033F036C7
MGDVDPELVEVGGDAVDPTDRAPGVRGHLSLVMPIWLVSSSTICATDVTRLLTAARTPS